MRCTWTSRSSTIKNCLACLLVEISLPILLYGCASNEPLSQALWDIGVALGGGFYTDKVQVSIDGQPVFEDTVTTNLSLSYAGGAPVSLRSGSHVVDVTIDDSLAAREEFVAENVKTIWIDYLRQ